MTFSADTIIGAAPLEVTFTDTTAGSIVAWDWDFGDGSTASETDAETTHTYYVSGLRTVVLVVTYDDDSQDTFTIERYIVIDEQPTVLQETCLRFATEMNEGRGWSVFDGDYWLSPMDNYGAFKILDANKVPRTICFDKNDYRIWEFDTFNRITRTRPSPVDKETVYDEEIVSAKWEGQTVFSKVEMHKFMSHLNSHVNIEPEYPENRGGEGYTASGQRNAQQLSLSAYLDGEQTDASGVVSDFPEKGEVVFSGRRIKDNKVQLVVSGTASEIFILNHIHEFLGSDEVPTTARRTMSEHTLQRELATGMVLHFCRSRRPLLNRATGTIVASASAGEGPDGRSDSSVIVSEDVACDNVVVTTNYTVIIWIKTGNGFTAVTGMSQQGSTVGGWTMWYLKGSGGLAASLVLEAGEYFAVRIYSKQISDSALALLYEDIVDFNGVALLPTC